MVPYWEHIVFYKLYSDMSQVILHFTTLYFTHAPNFFSIDFVFFSFGPGIKIEILDQSL